MGHVSILLWPEFLFDILLEKQFPEMLFLELYEWIHHRHFINVFVEIVPQNMMGTCKQNKKIIKTSVLTFHFTLLALIKNEIISLRFTRTQFRLRKRFGKKSIQLPLISKLSTDIIKISNLTKTLKIWSINCDIAWQRNVTKNMFWKIGALSMRHLSIPRKNIHRSFLIQWYQMSGLLFLLLLKTETPLIYFSEMLTKDSDQLFYVTLF